MSNQSEFSSFKKKTRETIISATPFPNSGKNQRLYSGTSVLLGALVYQKCFPILGSGYSTFCRSSGTNHPRAIPALPNSLPKIGKQVLLYPDRRRPEPGWRDKIPAGSRTLPADLFFINIRILLLVLGLFFVFRYFRKLTHSFNCFFLAFKIQ